MIHLEDKWLRKIEGFVRLMLPPGGEIWAFGSRVKGTHRQSSDLDLVVVYKDPLPRGVLSELGDVLTECRIPIKVDLVEFYYTSPTFKKIILEQYEVLWRL